MLPQIFLLLAAIIISTEAFIPNGHDTRKFENFRHKLIGNMTVQTSLEQLDKAISEIWNNESKGNWTFEFNDKFMNMLITNPLIHTATSASNLSITWTYPLNTSLAEYMKEIDMLYNEVRQNLSNSRLQNLELDDCAHIPVVMKKLKNIAELLADKPLNNIFEELALNYREMATVSLTMNN